VTLKLPDLETAKQAIMGLSILGVFFQSILPFLPLEAMLAVASVLVLAVSIAANPTNPLVNAISPSFCYKWTYGRGFGVVPSHCSKGFERNGALCYPDCQSGYVGNGPVCWEHCPQNYVNDGAVCRKKGSLALHWKKSHGRGWGKPVNCGDGYHAKSGLCYKDCRDGFEGVGPVCHQKCAGTFNTNCGAGCTKSKMDCASGLVGMVGAAGISTAGFMWGPWNAVWPVVAGGWTAVTALTNGQCPNPDAEDKYPFTPATYVAASWTATTAYTATYTGVYVDTPTYSTPTPYLEKVVAYATPTDVTYGQPSATHTPVVAQYSVPTLYTPAYTAPAAYQTYVMPAPAYSVPAYTTPVEECEETSTTYPTPTAVETEECHETVAESYPTPAGYDVPETVETQEAAIYSGAQATGLSALLLAAVLLV
jgi:hypothetical protein